MPAAFFEPALRRVPKKELTPLKLEHIFLFMLGAALLKFGDQLYHRTPSTGQIIILIIYLGLLVGIAPLPMPVFRSKFMQVLFAGLISGVLDSFIVLEQSKRLRTIEPGQDRDEVSRQKHDQEVEGVRATFLALLMIAALIGGIIIWFGEVYAAGVYLNDGRTGILAALYVVPPVLVFLSVLGWHASLLPIEVVPNLSVKTTPRDALEFAVGVGALLVLHNPLVCLGGLLVYAVVTRQDDRLLDIWKFHTEVNVMLVLLLALFAGEWLVGTIIEPAGLHQGEIAPIVPAALQAVLWGPLYTDQSVHFWMRVTTLSTGALLMPISSLVGVMLFRSFRQWWLYIRISIMYAAFWYLLMRTWMWLTLGSDLGNFLERWAHS